MKEDLVVSFSGGRTSGYMSHKLIESNNYNLHFVFMNTGCEHERTLWFVNECDKYFGMNLTWIEAVTHSHERRASTHKVVSYETASRNGEPFEKTIRKYGIPSAARPECTRNTKTNPFLHWIKTNDLEQCRYAIGIRADEFDRMRDNPKIFYPLISPYPTKKDDVLAWWGNQPFDLNLPEHLGNCTWCWKKSYRKLALVWQDMPEAFDFPKRMEQECGLIGPEKQKGPDGRGRRFFRGQLYADELKRVEQQHELFDMPTGTCGDSCEVFLEEDKWGC